MLQQVVCCVPLVTLWWRVLLIIFGVEFAVHSARGSLDRDGFEVAFGINAGIWKCFLCHGKAGYKCCVRSSERDACFVCTHPSGLVTPGAAEEEQQSSQSRSCCWAGREPFTEDNKHHIPKCLLSQRCFSSPWRLLLSLCSVLSPR